jgi:hypothetical protein
MRRKQFRLSSPLEMGEGDEETVSSLPPGRARSAWKAWLRALADDAEAALAAALTYEALGEKERDSWLDALDEDAPEVLVPRESLYAPLLMVEDDPVRRLRIATSCGDAQLRGEARAWCGTRSDGVRVCVVVAPLWLRFVETLRCGYSETDGFVFAEHDPLRAGEDVDVHAPATNSGGAKLERADLSFVVEELAHAVLAAKRAAREVPAAVVAFAHLFTPEREAVTT